MTATRPIHVIDRRMVGYLLTTKQMQRLLNAASRLRTGQLSPMECASLAEGLLRIVENAKMGPLTASQLRLLTAVPAIAAEAPKASPNPGEPSIRREDAGSSLHSVHQKWTASTREELEQEAAEQLQRYHPSGYGTRISNYKDHGTHWSCEFYRGTSCD